MPWARAGVLISIVVLVSAACGQGSASSAPASPAAPGSAASGAASASTAGAPPSAGSPTAPGALAWLDCAGGLQCARIEVPLDHAQPDGTKISISLARLPARDPAHRAGSLVLDFGGPSESGVRLLQGGVADLLPDALRDRFDLVSFDPRGSGGSSPILCPPASTITRMREIDPLARTAAQREAVERASREAADACEASYPRLLPHLSTDDVARDLDLIRAALGEDRLTYLGYSWGTYLGARYATLFPAGVRALVLDAAIDGRTDPIVLFEDEVKAEEAALDRFFERCAADASCAFHSGGDPASAFDRVRARIAAAPIDAGGGRSLGIGDAVGGIVALLERAEDSGLAAGLAAAERGDGSVLLAAADLAVGRYGDGQYDSTVSANAATQCMNYPIVPPRSAWVALAARTASEAPRLGGAYTVGCTYWHVHPPTVPPPLVAPAGTPLVVIGGTGDPVTPYAWSERMAKALGNAVLVTRRGEGHTTLADPGNACVNEAVSAYLVDLKVPAAGLIC